MLSAPGIGSGLDVNSIISQLMSVEQQPLVKLSTRAIELRTQISAYGALKSVLSSFRDSMNKLNDLSSFKVFSAKSSDETVLSASADSAAAKGSYSMVVNRIAENHRMASNQTFANTDTTLIGTAGDTMTISVGLSDFNVEIGGKTLAQIRDAINSASTNSGATASIIHEDTGYRLLLSSDDTGSSDALSVTYSAADPFTMQTLNLDRNSSGGFTAADLDASVKLENQYDITSSSNSITDAIGGVTLTLKKAGTITLNVDKDTASVQAAVGTFAKGYSDLVRAINDLRAKGLKSDSNALRDIVTQFRNVLNTEADVGSTFSLAFEVGLSTQKDGTMTLNATTLSGALSSDFDGVAKLFADPDNGIAVRLSDLADNFLSATGVVQGRTESLNRQVRDVDSRRESIQKRLEIIESRYRRQFSSLDTLVSSLQSTGNFLTQQLNLLSRSRSG